MKIIKRNGKQQKFDDTKIKKAILGAYFDVNPNGEVKESYLDSIVSNVVSQIKDKMTVEQIQDIVENVLMENKEYEVAKAYIKYRYLHKIARDKYADMMSAIREKIEAKSVQNQNANMDENSFGGKVNEASGLILKQFALDYCMSAKSKQNHLNNRIYIHDLDHYALGDHNCLTMPIDKLLANGFKTRQTDVRPANSISTAMQLVAVLFQLQSLQQFGGVSASHIDWSMVPFVRKSFAKHYKDGCLYVSNIKEIDYEIANMLANAKDYSIEDSEYKAYSIKAYDYAINMTKRECHQAVEALYHNLNTLQSRSGCQLPFTSINYGTCILSEGRMITEELLKVSIEGLGKLHRTSIFPCGIFQCMKGVNRKPGEPNYDLFKLALESTSKRLYPNYVNVDWSNNAGYDRNDPRTYTSTMGCRTYNGYDINGLGQLKDGRGNLAPVTIILPTLAMEAKEEVKTNNSDLIDTFFRILDKAFEDAKDTLIERYEYMCSQSPKAATFMYENKTMEGYIPEEGIVSALKHGTLVIGQLGLAECLQLLIGENQTTTNGMKLAKKIEQRFNHICAQYKKHYKLNFGVYYTPAENLCKTAMKKFQDEYGVIEKVSDKKYFTNSIHVPVYEKVNAFEKIDIESQLTGYSNAGCITYVELDASSINNIEAIEKIVNYAMDKDIPYFAINVPADLCEDCGYQGEMLGECPQCHSHNIQQLRRVTGYLTGNYKTAFNEGKQAEVEDRVKHTGVSIDENNTSAFVDLLNNEMESLIKAHTEE